MSRLVTLILTLLLTACGTVGGRWMLEAEGDGADVVYSGDTLTLSAPAGASLWWSKKLTGDVEVSYRARVLAEPRVSDLNCFFMASSRGVGSGRFVEQYRMKLYYVGFGGNTNTTTRFRRYTGDSRGVEQEEFRPEILTEYTDAAHLLQPDRWYDIRITKHADRIQYWVDGEMWVDYTDPAPLHSGYFALRTTWSRVQITNFRIR